MSFLFKPNFKTVSCFIRSYSISRQNHYEVLRLQKSCSDKDIKEAFFKLSKEYHPDKNKDARAKEQFVRIVEAYNVLSKPGSRAQYDSMTHVPSSSTGSYTSYVYRTHVPHNLRNNPEYSYYYGTKEESDTKYTKNRSYYGVSGIKKMPNSYIILICFTFALVGFIVQMIVIRNSFFMHRRQQQEKSMRNAAELDRVRARALDNGNELQSRLLLDKIVEAANPTVATASLGQALATEKKQSSEKLLSELDVSDISQVHAIIIENIRGRITKS